MANDRKQVVERMLVHARTTKGTYFYSDPKGSGSAITSIYLRKDGMPDPPPAAIVVTISTEDS